MSNKGRIQEIEKDIRILCEMKRLYEGASLSGNYYTDMMGEIDLQLKDCNEWLYNLKQIELVND